MKFEIKLNPDKYSGRCTLSVRLINSWKYLMEMYVFQKRTSEDVNH